MLGTKYTVWMIAGFLILVSALGFVVFNQYEIGLRQQSIEKGIVKQKELANKILRSQSQYATDKDLKDFAKENNTNIGKILKDLKTLNAEVASVNNAKVISVGVSKKDVSSTSVGEANPNPPQEVQCINGQCENPDKHGFLLKEQRLTLKEPFSDGTSVPVGEVGFSAWKENPWAMKLHAREYSVTTVVGVDEERRQYFYNKFTVEVNGKTHELPISSAETRQKFPTAKIHWFNPSLNMGIAGGTYLSDFNGEVVPNISLSLISYGKYKAQSDFKILSVGVGYGTSSDRFHVAVSPVYYNLGNHLPLVNNLYLGPVVSMSSKGDSALLLGVSVGL